MHFAMILILASLCACSSGNSGKVLATVGGEEITEADLELVATVNPKLKAQIATEFGRKKIIDNLIDQEIFYKESLKEGYDRKKDVKDKLAIFEKVIVSDAYINNKLEEAAKKYYTENNQEFNKLDLSHIMIKFTSKDTDKITKTEKQAIDEINKIKERIQKGEKFEDIAKEVSEDNLTKKRGGNLGMVSKNEQKLARKGYGNLLDKAFSIKEGEISGPIKTEKAYHLIMVNKAPQTTSFEDTKSQILIKIRAKAHNQMKQDLRTKYKVEYSNAKKENAPSQKQSVTE